MARGSEPDAATLAQSPQVRLHGPVGDETLDTLLAELNTAERGEGPIAIEVTTTGGDAEIGRRLALEIDLARRLGRRLVFVGKTAVFSAGATIMAGFPVADRYLTRDAVILVHCRKLEKTLALEGPLKANQQRVRQVLAEIENGLRVEREGFEAFVNGSDVSLEEVEEKAPFNWYIGAQEALDRRLVAGLV